MNESEFTINGKTFRFVKRSRREEVSIYTSGDLYARIGEREVLEKVISLHQQFAGIDCPVPIIVGRGEISGSIHYYLEESLGGKHFSGLFSDDTRLHGIISLDTFEKFLKITEKFAKAQLQSAVSVPDIVSFADLIDPRGLSEELPEYKEKIFSLFDQAISALKHLPFVLTHGDLNPHNLFPRGVIDFEKLHYGPAGYDIVTNIFSINYFPKSQEYEYYQHYSFTPEQEVFYYDRLDQIYLNAGLTKISDYKKHFEYCRAIWAAKQNFSAPKLQHWRYELFKKQYLL